MRTSFVRYGYRKCEIHARVSSQTPAHGNTKNETRHENRGRRQKRRVNIERSMTCRDKKCPDGLAVTRAYVPKGLPLPEEVYELPNPIKNYSSVLCGLRETKAASATVVMALLNLPCTL